MEVLFMTKHKITQYDVELGKKLEQLRKERGLTLQQVADLMNVTRAQVYRWEKAENRITVYQFVNYCEILNVGISELANSIDDSLLTVKA